MTVLPREHARLAARVARLYHEEQLTQPEIATMLGISQARVSRLLKKALDSGIVKISVTAPPGVHADLEAAIEARFGIDEAVVVDSTATHERQLHRDLGRAAAFYLEASIRSGDVVGISPWSASVAATVHAIRSVSSTNDVRVVQLVGGGGAAGPSIEATATETTSRLAQLLRGEPFMLPVPSVLGDSNTRRILESDERVRRVLDLHARLDVALVGIGTMEPSGLLVRSGNAFCDADIATASGVGAVGEIVLRYLDLHGNAVRTSLDERVLGIRLETLRTVPRRIAVAGGEPKATAITAALNSGLVTHLVTDHRAARALLATSAAKA